MRICFVMMAAANHEYSWRCTINAMIASNNTQIYHFLERAGELRINILSRKGGKETPECYRIKGLQPALLEKNKIQESNKGKKLDQTKSTTQTT